MTELKYRICWRAKESGRTGEGPAIWSEQEAREYAAEMGERYEFLDIWYEPYDSGEEENGVKNEKNARYSDIPLLIRLENDRRKKDEQ